MKRPSLKACQSRGDGPLDLLENVRNFVRSLLVGSIGFHLTNVQVVCLFSSSDNLIGNYYIFQYYLVQMPGKFIQKKVNQMSFICENKQKSNNLFIFFLTGVCVLMRKFPESFQCLHNCDVPDVFQYPNFFDLTSFSRCLNFFA